MASPLQQAPPPMRKGGRKGRARGSGGGLQRWPSDHSSPLHVAEAGQDSGFVVEDQAGFPLVGPDAAGPAGEIEITVTTMSGKEIVVRTAKAGSVRDLKAQLCAEMGLDHFRIRLVSGTRPLSNEGDKLTALGVMSGTKLTLVVLNPSAEVIDPVYDRSGLIWWSAGEGHLASSHFYRTLPSPQRMEAFHAVTVDMRVRKLTLKDAGLRDQDAMLMAGPLESAVSLHALNLSDNQIGAAGALRLAEVLRVNMVVCELYFYNNPIDVAGKSRLFQAKEELVRLRARGYALLLF